MKKITLNVIPAVVAISLSSGAYAKSGNFDLDDIRNWNIVKMETCLDAALDTIPGQARKLEMKMEKQGPVYEFDIKALADGNTYNVQCNAEKGYITEIEREVDANDPVFKKLAKITQDEAREIALSIHPGKVVSSELEISYLGVATYEFDILSIHGYEIKVDVNAATGQIEEANIELYEIGMEKD